MFVQKMQPTFYFVTRSVRIIIKQLLSIRKICMNDINIIKKLGSGMAGSVYLANSNGKECALKIEKISDNKIEHNLKYEEWREIEFSENFANNFPDQFITLYGYDIIPNCVYEYTDDYRDHLQKLPENVKNRFLEKEKGNHCIRKLYSLVDSNIKKPIDKFTKQQLYSAITQMCCICYLMQKHGYTHNDLHSGNIGVLLTSNKYVNILDKKVKSFGIHIFALDFGNVLHEKYGLNDEEIMRHHYNLKHDIDRFVKKLVSIEKNEYFNKLINWNDNTEIFKLFLKSDYYKMTKQFSPNKYDRLLLFQVLYPEAFQKMYLKEKYVKTYQVSLLCDKDDFLFLFKNKKKLKKCIKYFANKTNQMK